MGGAAKSVANTVGRVGSGILTLGGSELSRKYLPQRSVANQLFQAPGTILTGGQSSLSSYGGDNPNPYVSGPFSLDPEQYAQDKSEILGLGDKQYSDTLGAIDTNSAAQTQRAKDLFGQMLPDIAENAQAAHLYDSTGYGQEVARQQGNIASQVASDSAQQKLQALSGRQGFETGALQRGQSLEDFINQANVAKTIGAQMAPQPPTGKQNFGTVAQGVGALSPFAKLGKAAGAVK
jgi:hypothetical protein